MRSTLFGALVLLLISSCKLSHRPSTDEAVKYNDSLITIMEPYFSAEDEFGYALLDDSTDLQAALTKYEGTIDQVLGKLNALPQFDSEDALRKASLNYMNIVKKTVAAEYGKAVELKMKPAFKDSDSDQYLELFEQYQAAYDRAQKEITEAGDEFDHKQDSFAAGYNFTIDR